MSTERASNAHWKPDTKIARRNDEHQKGQCLSESHQGLVPWKMIKFNPGLSLTLSKVSCLRTCNLSLQNTAEPFLWDTVTITQNVIRSNT